MNRPLDTATTAAQKFSLLTQPGQLAQADRRPLRTRPLMRKYEVAFLSPNSAGMTATRLAPATTTFEMAFMAFARGTLFATPLGPTAIEDLQPGDLIKTVEHGAQPIIWKGATTLVPGAPGQSSESAVLTRLSTDAMGFGRPEQDLLLGCAGRLYRAGNTNGYAGTFTEAADLIDDMNVIQLNPPSPVRMFHIATQRHCRLTANGIDVESFHPGTRHGLGLSLEMMGLYVSLFPHIQRLNDFGPMIAPRLTSPTRQTATD